MGPFLNFDNFLFILKKNSLGLPDKMYGHPIYVGYLCDHINWSRVGAVNSNFSIFITFLPQVCLAEYLFPNLKVGVITLTWASQGSEVKNLL